MEWLLIPVALGVVAGALYLSGHRGNAYIGQGRVMSLAARTLGAKWNYSRIGLTGERDGFELIIESLGVPGVHGLRITVQSTVGSAKRIPSSLRLFCESHQGHALHRTEEDVPTGDPEFDRYCRLGAEWAQAAALMDAGARKAILNVIYGRTLQIKEGRLVLDSTVGARTIEDITGLIKEVLWVANELTKEGSEMKRLEGNTLNDPVPAVRMQNLKVMIDLFRDHPVTQRALRRAVKDENPEARLVAAVAMGEEGFTTLRDLVCKPERPDAVAVKALAALMEGFSRERVLPVVRKAFAIYGGSLEIALLGAFGALGDEESEGVVLASLEGADRPKRFAAVNALGEIGTARSVGPLRKLEREKRLDYGFRSAVNGAIAQIRAVSKVRRKARCR